MPSKFWAAKVTGKRPFHGQVQGIFENQVSKFWDLAAKLFQPNLFDAHEPQSSLDLRGADLECALCRTRPIVGVVEWV